jgi:hypothetical protein
MSLLPETANIGAAANSCFRYSETTVTSCPIPKAGGVCQFLVSQHMPIPGDEILLDETAFWVGTRGRCFGPFDYQWSADLRGVELTYQGQKFGEICGPEQLYADLTEFGLPISVCQVAAITAGTMAAGIANGHCREERVSSLLTSLESFGYSRYRVRETG